VSIPRVAFFTDSFHEVNGVALTSREFARFAQQKEYPFLSIHVGPETRHWAESDFETLELKNSWGVLQLDTNLAFDLLFMRHLPRLRTALKQFRPDLVHITGPGHCGILGAILAHQLNVPLVASWHTNVHEFAARRLARLLYSVPAELRHQACRIAEQGCLNLITRFYRRARLCFAPNPELVSMLMAQTGCPTHLMLRGIDSNLFSPAHRHRSDRDFVIGCVGRLSPEKNVRALVEVERGLFQSGIENYRFLVVGDGSQRQWLASKLCKRELPGILRGEELARAYASMDAFVFPSETDTFGNVVLEAMSSGVPPIVSAKGGPKYLIRPGLDGFLAEKPGQFITSLLDLYRDAELRKQMAANARQGALAFSWSSVFDGVYRQYHYASTSGALSRSRWAFRSGSALARQHPARPGGTR
jgi:glycosyltransferase involved in cell wall biosynthesis